MDAVAPFWGRASPRARTVIERMGACGTWNGYSFTYAGNPARYRCRQHTCDSCGTRWKKRTAAVLAVDVRSLAASDFTNVRRVTLNFAVVWDRGVTATVEETRAMLGKLFERRLRDFALIGGFDFALRPFNRTMVHAHAVLIGPPERLDEAEGILRGICQGPRKRSSNELKDQLEDDRDGPFTWLSYALDSAITARKHHRKPNWDNHCLASPSEKLRWIELHAGLRNQKGNAIRLTIKLGSARMLKRRKPKKIECPNCPSSGGIEGEMYEHLLTGLWVGGTTGSSSIRVEQLESSPQGCPKSADVRPGQPGTTPARGPP